MATRQHAIRHDQNGLPLRAPPWSFLAFTLLSLLVFLAIIYGFVHAGAFSR
jgi:hypothetical protein